MQAENTMSRFVPTHTVLARSPAPKPFFTRFFIRSRLNQPFLTIECADVQAIVMTGSEKLPNFSARNPWIFSDSVRGMAWVFVDLETQIQRETSQ